MEDQGFIKGREVKQEGTSGMPRRLYKITGLGQRALAAWEAARSAWDGAGEGSLKPVGARTWTMTPRTLSRVKSYVVPVFRASIHCTARQELNVRASVEEDQRQHVPPGTIDTALNSIDRLGRRQDHVVRFEPFQASLQRETFQSVNVAQNEALRPDDCSDHRVHVSMTFASFRLHKAHLRDGAASHTSAEMQEEYFEALKEGRLQKARWVRVRGLTCFWTNVALHQPVSATRLAKKLWTVSGG